MEDAWRDFFSNIRLYANDLQHEISRRRSKMDLREQFFFFQLRRITPDQEDKQKKVFYFPKERSKHTKKALLNTKERKPTTGTRHSSTPSAHLR